VLIVAHRLLLIERPTLPHRPSLCGLFGEGFTYEQIDWEALVPDRLASSAAHLVVAVADRLSAKVGQLFEWLGAHPIAIPTLAVVPREGEDRLIQIASDTSDDFILSPFGELELRHRVDRMLGKKRAEVEGVQNRLIEELGLVQLVGTDPVFVRSIEQIPRMARSGMPVLITGETGTGKELCARAIHHTGPRRNFPFIAADCGAIPDNLFENELFGHARGAYTDAHRDQRGLVAMAEGGTLFLDEIDSLSLVAQGKLLRLLQERSFRPLGADRFQKADLNVIAATNRDLEQGVACKQFRSDLYFRLNVLRLHLPPLRERRADIGMLAAHFLEESRAANNPAARTFSAAALRALALYDWPGNVRELANVIQRAAVACDDSRILPAHFAFPHLAGQTTLPLTHFRAARAAAVAAFERRYLEDVLRTHNGNVTYAAREANKDRRVFGRLMKKYGVDRAQFRR
jgi:two-component system, NtrC family, response regulator GlrR